MANVMAQIFEEQGFTELVPAESASRYEVRIETSRSSRNLGVNYGSSFL